MARRDFGHQLFWGLLLIFLGVGLLLDQADLWNFGWVVGNFWPMIIILPALYALVMNRGQSPAGSLIVLAIGVILQLSTLDFVNWNIWSVIWPTVLVIIGLSILFRNVWKTETKVDSVNYNVMFSGLEKKIRSDDFKGGTTTTLFGGTSLDLRDAHLIDDAELNVMVLFGGLELRVPENVNVDIRVLPILGGAEDKSETRGKDTKRLVITGTVAFGGIEIKN